MEALIIASTLINPKRRPWTSEDAYLAAHEPQRFSLSPLTSLAVVLVGAIAVLGLMNV